VSRDPAGIGVAKARFYIADGREHSNGVQQMTNENEQRNTDDTVTHGTESVAGADRAMRDAVQKYIDRAGMKIDLKKVEQQIRDKPFPSAAIAAAVGFVVGGGLVTRPGMALIALFGRSAARETMTNVVSGRVRRKFR
jgi:ElaB/YqjD/DUF883 family membrane-anchored ribosome-binding protein